MKQIKIFLIGLFIILIITSAGLFFFQKIKKDETDCVSRCGDGICQEIVCEGSNCDCAENSASCPQDCPRPSSTKTSYFLSCQTDIDCPADSYCREGECREFFPDTSCQSDSDCSLYNSSFRLGCCWKGICEPVDLSLDNWTAINRRWLLAKRNKECPPEDKCALAAPTCSPILVNDRFIAKCSNGKCRKYPL